MPKYHCECCNYNTIILTHYKKHLKTKKHLEKLMYPKCIQNVSKCIIFVSKMYPKLEKVIMARYECSYCGKSYKYSQGLSKHIKYSGKKNKDEDMKELAD